MHQERKRAAAQQGQRLAEIGAALPDDVRVVVVSGAGPSFSAGLDRSMFGTLPAQLEQGDSAFLDLIASYQAGFTWLRNPEFVSIGPQNRSLVIWHEDGGASIVDMLMITGIDLPAPLAPPQSG